MHNTNSKLSIGNLSVFFFAAFFYSLFVIQPAIILHYKQAPYIFSPESFKSCFIYPGGLSKLASNLIMQSFIINALGAAVLTGLSFLVFWLTRLLLNKNGAVFIHGLLALIPAMLVFILCNNYNFQLSIVVATILVLILTVLFIKFSNNMWMAFPVYFFSSLLIYYACGSGYLLLYSSIVFFVKTKMKSWEKVVFYISLLMVVYFIPEFMYNRVFPIPPNEKYFYFFTGKIYFLQYKPSILFFGIK